MLVLSLEVAINRFKKETLRIFGVLELQLSGKYSGEEKDYLSGNGRGKYSVADIAAWRKWHAFELSDCVYANCSKLGSRVMDSQARLMRRR